MRKYVGTVAVVAVFCVLLGLFLWSRARPPQSQEEAGAAAPVEVYSISDQDVVGVELLPAGVQLARGAGGAWQLQDAPDLPLDQERLDLLMSVLCKLEADRKVAEPGADLVQFGLQTPQVQVRLALSGGGTKTVLVGDELPVKGAFYCAVSDSGAVYTLASHRVELLRQTRDDFRARGLAGFDSSRVARFSLYVSGELRLKASLLGETSWAMEAPWPCVLDALQVQSLLSAYSSLQADSFPCDSPAPQDLQAFGLDQPRLRLALDLKGGGSAEVRVGRAEGEGQAYVQGARGPWVFLAATSQRLEPQPFDLLDQRVLPFDQAGLERLEIAWGTSSWAEAGTPAWPAGQSVAVQKKGQGWELTAGGAASGGAGGGGKSQPSSEQLQSLVSSLEWLGAGGVAGAGEVPTGARPALGLKARSAGGGEASVVLLEGAGGRWYGRLGRSGPAVWVDGEALQVVGDTFPSGGK